MHQRSVEEALFVHGAVELVPGMREQDRRLNLARPLGMPWDVEFNYEVRHFFERRDQSGEP